MLIQASSEVFYDIRSVLDEDYKQIQLYLKTTELKLLYFKQNRKGACHWKLSQSFNPRRKVRTSLRDFKGRSRYTASS